MKQAKLDRAGRIMVPKALRQQLRLEPGDSVELEVDGEQITLTPVRPQALLRKERGVWVYQGAASDQSIIETIDQVREGRLRTFTE